MTTSKKLTQNPKLNLHTMNNPAARPAGTLYTHTRPASTERPAEWYGPYWPTRDNVDMAPNAGADQWYMGPGNPLNPPDWIGTYQSHHHPYAPAGHKTRKAWIIGGGIAGLAAAHYLIEDGRLEPSNITIIEGHSHLGGALNAYGNAEEGYISPGAREFSFNYQNLWDLMSKVQSTDLPEGYSVLDEFRLLNDSDPNYSIARIIHNKGEILPFGDYGLSPAHQKLLNKLMMMKKEECYNIALNEFFPADFFQTRFWTFWRSMFAFFDWQSLLQLKLYMHRYLEGCAGQANLSPCPFSKYNQQANLILPLANKLKKLGVKVRERFLVEDMELASGTAPEGETLTVTKILGLDRATNQQAAIEIGEGDIVLAGLGSNVAGTATGDNKTVPKLAANYDAQWKLWRNLAKKSPRFGNPEPFCGDISKTTWVSATLTAKWSALWEKIQSDYAVHPVFSGRTVTGGGITITDSNWNISFTVDRQPFNPGQPEDVICAWMYGLSNNKPGNYIKKPMPECTGDEILAELCYHLGLEDKIEEIAAKTIVRTALMPYVNSFFQPYGKDDRPQIMPAGVTNLALMGQYVDQVNDCSFTVESSVRTARIAVAQTLALAQQISDVAPTQYDMRLFLQAARAMNNMQPSALELALRPHLEGTYFEDILPPAAETSEAEGF